MANTHHPTGVPKLAKHPQEMSAPAEPAFPADWEPGSGHAGWDNDATHPGWETEKAREQARQQAMAAREKAIRTQSAAGQSAVMRLKKGNQPRGGH